MQSVWVMTHLRSQILKLAYVQPDLQKYLLPVILGSDKECYLIRKANMSLPLSVSDWELQKRPEAADLAATLSDIFTKAGRQMVQECRGMSVSELWEQGDMLQINPQVLHAFSKAVDTIMDVVQKNRRVTTFDTGHVVKHGLCLLLADHFGTDPKKLLSYFLW